MAALRESLRCLCLVWAFAAFASADSITVYGSGSDVRTILSPPDFGVPGFAPVYHEGAVALFNVPPGEYTAAAFVLPVAGITPHSGLPQAPYNTEIGLSEVPLPGPWPLLASSATGGGGFGLLSIHFDDFPQFAGTMLSAADEFDSGGWFAITGHIYGGGTDYWW